MAAAATRAGSPPGMNRLLHTIVAWYGLLWVVDDDQRLAWAALFASIISRRRVLLLLPLLLRWRSVSYRYALEFRETGRGGMSR